MQSIKPIEKYSLGMGDRFARQGKAQLQAIMQARALGIEVTPVWNKSNREHTLVGTEPASVLAEAESAVAALGFDGSFHIDADHINFVRIVDVVGSINPVLGQQDSLGNLVNDPYPTAFASGGFDLDGVAVMNRVPEPGSIVLLAAGLALIACLARKRRGQFVRA